MAALYYLLLSSIQTCKYTAHRFVSGLGGNSSSVGNAAAETPKHRGAGLGVTDATAGLWGDAPAITTLSAGASTAADIVSQCAAASEGVHSVVRQHIPMGLIAMVLL